MSIADLKPTEVVVVPLQTMLAVCDYIGGRPFAEVAPLALQLGELTTVQEYRQARRRPPKETS